MDLKAKIIRTLTIMVLMSGFAGMISCEKYVWSPPEVSDDIVISFSEHIYPLCTSCHTSWSVPTAYDKLFARVDTVTPEESTILTFHSSILSDRSIQVNDTLTMKSADVIKLWAKQGGENN